MSGSLPQVCAAALRAWTPPGAEQDALRREFLTHLDRHLDGWSRTCRPAHLTASALVCAPEQQEVLLVHHRLIGRWLQTGGHIEATDASLVAAAVREAREESGLTDLDLDPHPVQLTTHEVPCRPNGWSRHLDVQYLVRSAAGGLPSFGTESLDVRWFPAADLPETDASVRGLVLAASARLGW